MFGAIHIGLSGLTAYSRGLQQVSNNVSNLNSSGFKASTVSFTDLVGVHGNGGLSFTRDNESGGGNGVNINDAKRDFRQGELRQSDRDLDLAVDGQGFLVLLKGNEIAYTRTGSFEVDKDGFITLAGTEYRLATLNSEGVAVSLSLDASRTHAPQKTTSIKFLGNLSADFPTRGNPNFTEPFTLSSIKVFDSKGGEHVWKIAFERKNDPPTEWKVTVTDDKGVSFPEQTLKFVQSDTGRLVVDPTTKSLAIEDSANGMSVTLDFSAGVSSDASGTLMTLGAKPADGFGSGTLTTVTVNADGELELSYSNEQKKQLGAVALADFRNPQALEQRSGGLFAEAGDLAQRTLLSSRDARVGQVLSRRIEASNVDLAKQFGDLILIQRGFQASSQIISVSNDMIQQLFGIRGQG